MTPFLKWKFDESNDKSNSVKVEDKLSGEVGRETERRIRAAVSARKLGAGLWRLHLPEFPMNGRKRSGVQEATTWDPVNGKKSGQLNQIFGQPKLLRNQQQLEKQLEEARARIDKLETGRKSSKNKLEQFLQKVSKERTAWRSREHGKIRGIIDDMKAELSQEKKNRERLEIANSKLVNDLADAKLSVGCYLQEYEKERKARELIEAICDELAKEFEEDKAEVEILERELKKLCEEVEDERKMLQMAEVWREERVQMKLADTKVMLEEKYSQMNRIIADLEAFLNSEDYGQDSKPLNVNPEAKLPDKDRADRRSNVYTDERGQIEDSSSDWETVSHLEDQGSRCSIDESDPYVNKSFRARNVSREWGRDGGKETPIMDSEVKKVSRPINGDSFKITSVEGENKKLSNGDMLSDCGQWSFPGSGNPHINRGAKECLKWPHSGQSSSSKSRPLEARAETEKIQLRDVLKQKI